MQAFIYWYLKRPVGLGFSPSNLSLLVLSDLDRNQRYLQW
jgi:hypothetical protein